MIFTIVIVLIVALVVIAIVTNAIQQHKEQEASEKRTELSKHKAIIDEAEDVINAVGQLQLQVSQQLIYVIHNRILLSLKAMLELNPKMDRIKARIKESQDKTKAINVDKTPPPDEAFTLPTNEKQIIVLIQVIKKLRFILRSEHSKGNVDTSMFNGEDKRLERLQLRVNVDTLAKRADSAVQGNMLGSARQYYEKAIAAINAQKIQDEFTTSRRRQLEQRLMEIQDNLRNVNQADREARIEAEKDELDELFAPKKKW